MTVWPIAENASITAANTALTHPIRFGHLEIDVLVFKKNVGTGICPLAGRNFSTLRVNSDCADMSVLCNRATSCRTPNAHGDGIRHALHLFSEYGNGHDENMAHAKPIFMDITGERWLI